jgi:putative endopeptidase
VRLRLRVVSLRFGALSNLPEFQQTFWCKDNAPIVRPAQKRCDVW